VGYHRIKVDKAYFKNKFSSGVASLPPSPRYGATSEGVRVRAGQAASGLVAPGRTKNRSGSHRIKVDQSSRVQSRALGQWLVAWKYG